MRSIFFFLVAACATSKPATPSAPGAPQHVVVLPITPSAVAYMADGGCITRCGMVSPAGNCRGLQEAETAALVAYAQHVRGWTYLRECEAISGWTVYVLAGTHDSTWILPAPDDDLRGEPARILGMTLLPSDTILLASAEWDASALAHELGHVLRWRLDGVVGGHEKWTELGLCAAINQAGRLKCEPSAPQYSAH